MSAAPRVHVQRVTGTTGAPALLVVPAADDATILRWALESMIPAGARRWLAGFGGWEVAAPYEGVLWIALAQGAGPDAACPHCWHRPEPCDAWVEIVCHRFWMALQMQRIAAWTAEDERKLMSGFRPDRAHARATPPEPEPPPPPPPREHRRPPPRSKATGNVVPQVDAAGVARAAARLDVAWPGARRREVVRAFRRAALEAHPDRGGTDAAMIEVIRARDVLLAQLPAPGRAPGARDAD